MGRLTKRSEDKNSTMVWFVDKESWDMRYEPCEMDSSQRRKVLCKLAEYEDAEENGLLLRLPCKVGDDVFFIPSKPNFDLNILHRREAFNRVYHQKIARIHIAEEHWYLEGNLNLEHGIDRLFVDKEYKEVWFLTREEAEQALKQMKGE